VPAVPAPTAETRWRCSLCGNLTRFDVERTVRSREYVHVDLAGVASVEEHDVVTETIDRVTCRWCRRPGSVELVARPHATVEAPVAGVAAAPGRAEPDLAGR
jgi:RNase P subunit RPR2